MTTNRFRSYIRRRTGAANAPSVPDIASTLTPSQRAIVQRARPYTMVSTERLVACLDAVDYVTKRGIRGALAECGVWRGGSVLAMILMLIELGESDRDVYLFDTFEGMTPPTRSDTSVFDGAAYDEWEKAVASGRKPWHTYFRPEIFSREQVEEVIYGTGYPKERIHFVAGRVEDTIPGAAPDNIAVLRLDTDWYESTKHELEHLYPRLATGGVLIVDDYGHWDGCRQAVDEYLTSANTTLLLSRIDYTGRIAIKP